MSTPFVGEIRMFGFGRTPNGWQACDGSLLSIAEYDVLYTLLGTTYGGDGQNTFGVPDLRGRVPLHQGQGPGLSNRVLGELSGTETVTLDSGQMPAHSHAVFATSNGASNGVASPSSVPGTISGDTLYATDITGLQPFTLAAATVSTAGGSQPHENTMPTLTVQFCIAWAGIYPSQN
jgi:microcystin-dependent protein